MRAALYKYASEGITLSHIYSIFLAESLTPYQLVGIPLALAGYLDFGACVSLPRVYLFPLCISPSCVTLSHIYPSPVCIPLPYISFPRNLSRVGGEKRGKNSHMYPFSVCISTLCVPIPYLCTTPPNHRMYSSPVYIRLR